MSEGEPPRDIKVTDRRMFTESGELREEYRFLDEEKGTGAQKAESRETAASEERDAGPPPPSRPAGRGEFDRGQTPPPREETAGPVPGGVAGSPSFFDLVGMIAEPATLYLGDARLPDGRSLEDLNLARFHIDLLDVLREKTAGNLGQEESAILEDTAYRLRLRYVQKRG